jgi:hypothetical protein
MLAAQLLGLHEAAMECLRRGAVAGQTFEGRQANLGQANKLVRSYAVLLEAWTGTGARAGRRWSGSSGSR